MSAGPIPDLIAAARRLIEAVEYDVNGINGKGGNGGLTSDQTIRAAAELRVILSRLDGHVFDDPAATYARAIGHAAAHLDAAALFAEKQAATTEDGLVHDAFLIASDLLELTAGEVRGLVHLKS